MSELDRLRYRLYKLGEELNKIEDQMDAVSNRIEELLPRRMYILDDE